jgi:hypothetical protein
MARQIEVDEVEPLLLLPVTPLSSLLAVEVERVICDQLRVLLPRIPVLPDRSEVLEGYAGAG